MIPKQVAQVNRQVNLTKRVKTKSGLRYCPVVLAANGRIRPNYVLIDGKQEAHPEGAYYLEWRKGTKRVRLSVGNNAADAVAESRRKQAEFYAVNSGVAVVSLDATDSRRSLPATATEYLEEARLRMKPRSYTAYSTALSYFQDVCSKPYLEDINRKDLLKFSAFLRDEKEQAPRSVYNKFEIMMTFLKAQGVRGLVGKNDWPRYTEEEPEMYEQEELDKLFAVCDPEERRSGLNSS